MLKRKDLKKITSVFLVVMLLLGCFSYLFVIETSAATPRWASILSVDLSMVVETSGGDVAGIAIKKITASKIEGTVTVYRLDGDNWVFVDEWYNSKTSGTLVVGGEFACKSGVSYKAVLVITAYTDNVPESFTVERIEVCP